MWPLALGCGGGTSRHFDVRLVGLERRGKYAAHYRYPPAFVGSAKAECAVAQNASDLLRRSYVTRDYLEATKGLNVVKTIYMEIDVAPEDQVAEVELVTQFAGVRSIRRWRR